MTLPHSITSCFARILGRCSTSRATAFITVDRYSRSASALDLECTTLSAKAKAAFLRSKGKPALAYLDDWFLCNCRAVEASHAAVLVSYFCGYFLPVKKCDWCPTTLQKYLGVKCGPMTAMFRVPQEKLDKMHHTLRLALPAGSKYFSSLQRVAGQCMSMSMSVRPALYTQGLFAALPALETSGLNSVDPTLDSAADLAGEMDQWLRIVSTSHEGP